MPKDQKANSVHKARQGPKAIQAKMELEDQLVSLVLLGMMVLMVPLAVMALMAWTVLMASALLTSIWTLMDVLLSNSRMGPRLTQVKSLWQKMVTPLSTPVEVAVPQTEVAVVQYHHTTA